MRSILQSYPGTVDGDSVISEGAVHLLHVPLWHVATSAVFLGHRTRGQVLKMCGG